MPKYLVESPHTAENCRLILNQVHAMGYLHNFEWGCGAGVHCGWAIIEAENETEAGLVVPMLVQKDARVIPIVKYSPDLISNTHEA